MPVNPFKSNSFKPIKEPSNGALMLRRMPLVLLLTMPLAACETTNGTASKAAQCAAWRVIRPAPKQDSAETVRQVDVHNLTGRKLGCW